MAASGRDERVDLRLTWDEKRLIRQAAKRQGMTMTQFLVYATEQHVKQHTLEVTRNG